MGYAAVFLLLFILAPIGSALLSGEFTVAGFGISMVVGVGSALLFLLGFAGLFAGDEGVRRDAAQIAAVSGVTLLLSCGFGYLSVRRIEKKTR